MKGLLNTPIGLLHRTKSLTYPGTVPVTLLHARHSAPGGVGFLLGTGRLSCSRGPKYSFSRGRALDASLSHSVFTTNNYITTPARNRSQSSRRTSAPPSNQRRTAAAMVLPLRAGVSQRGSVQCALVSVCSIHAIAQTPLPAINSWRSPSGNHAVAINCGNPWQSSSATIIDGSAPVNNK